MSNITTSGGAYEIEWREYIGTGDAWTILYFLFIACCLCYYLVPCCLMCWSCIIVFCHECVIRKLLPKRGINWGKYVNFKKKRRKIEKISLLPQPYLNNLPEPSVSRDVSSIQKADEDVYDDLDDEKVENYGDGIRPDIDVFDISFEEIKILERVLRDPDEKESCNTFFVFLNSGGRSDRISAFMKAYVLKKQFLQKRHLFLSLEDHLRKIKLNTPVNKMFNKKEFFPANYGLTIKLSTLKIGRLTGFCENRDIRHWLISDKPTMFERAQCLLNLITLVKEMYEMHDDYVYPHLGHKYVLIRSKDCDEGESNVRLYDYRYDDVFLKLLPKCGISKTRDFYYHSPEKLRKPSSEGEEVTVYAFGWLMYEILHGEFCPLEEIWGKGKSVWDSHLRNRPEFRPNIDETFERNPKYEWYLGLMKFCWSSEAAERPTFSNIRKTFMANYRSFDGIEDDPEDEGEDSDNVGVMDESSSSDEEPESPVVVESPQNIKIDVNMNNSGRFGGLSPLSPASPGSFMNDQEDMLRLALEESKKEKYLGPQKGKYAKKLDDEMHDKNQVDPSEIVDEIVKRKMRQTAQPSDSDKSDKSGSGVDSDLEDYEDLLNNLDFDNYDDVDAPKKEEVKKKKSGGLSDSSEEEKPKKRFLRKKGREAPRPLSSSSGGDNSDSDGGSSDMDLMFN